MKPRSNMALLMSLALLAACGRSSRSGTSTGQVREPPLGVPTMPILAVPEGSSAQVLGGARVHSLGEFGQARDYRMRVLDVRPCRVEPHFQPSPGRVTLGIRVELEGSSEREVPVNAFHAHLRSVDGEEFAPVPAGCQPTLPSSRLTRGTRAEGYLTFAIPDAARNLELRYAPQVIGPGVEELVFRVERP